MNWDLLLNLCDYLFQVIAAEGEMNASRALKEAADIISESPAALQLRYLQTLTTIAAEKNSTIIFPLPINFLARFLPSENKWPVDEQKEDISTDESLKLVFCEHWLSIKPDVDVELDLMHVYNYIIVIDRL